MTASVQLFQLASELEARLSSLPEQVTVLPLRSDGDGNGIYPEQTVSLVKDLRVEGVQAQFLDPVEARRFEVKKSAVIVGMIFVGLAIAQGASYDIAKAAVLRLIRKADKDRAMTLDFVRIEPTGATTAWRITGSSDDVVDALEALPPPQPPS